MGKKKDKEKRDRKERERAEEQAAAAVAPPVAETPPVAQVTEVADVAVPEPDLAGEVHIAAAAVEPLPTSVTVAHRPGRMLPGPPPGAPMGVAAREVVSRLAGSTLCYGEPVHVGDRAVIPAARVKARGGMGFGGRDAENGGGGGGLIDASPAGFIEVGPDGASYTAIPRSRAGGLAAGAALVAGAAAGLAGAVLASRRRPAPTGLRGFTRRLGR